MEPSLQAALESELATLLDAAEHERAAIRLVEGYGPEVLGFLVHLLGSESDADEVFAQWSEDLWAGLPGFARACSARTWLYVLARHAAARFRRSPWNRAARRTSDSKLDAICHETRRRTLAWLRTEVKDKWRALRESLDDDDRALLVLRVDRALPWRDVARVTLELDAPTDVELAREEERLHKRFAVLKRELRQRALAAGIVSDGEA